MDYQCTEQYPSDRRLLDVLLTKDLRKATYS